MTTLMTKCSTIFDHVHHIELFGRIVSHKLYSKIRQTFKKVKNAL